MKGALTVRNLTKRFRVGGGFLRRSSWLTAVDNVSFDIPAGTTFAWWVSRAAANRPWVDVYCSWTCLTLEPSVGQRRIHRAKQRELFNLRRRMQVIFQDPYASLSPRRTIAQTLLEPLEIHQVGDAKSQLERVVELLRLVGLRESVLHRYPHEFSGGQRQRVGIARALALQPDFIVADEAVSALDVSVQSQVLNLLRDIQAQQDCPICSYRTTFAVVQHISDRVGVMYLGQIVETGEADAVFWSPKHPYTEAL